MTHATEFGTYLCAEIPMAAHMGTTCSVFTPDGVSLTASAAPNMNNHGTIFGGSISSLMILAGWGQVKRLMDDIDPGALIVIRGTEVSFSKPVAGNFTAAAVPPAAEAMEKFRMMYTRRGMGKMVIEVTIGPADAPLAVMHGTYVISKNE